MNCRFCNIQFEQEDVPILLQRDIGRPFRPWMKRICADCLALFCKHIRGASITARSFNEYSAYWLRYLAGRVAAGKWIDRCEAMKKTGHGVHAVYVRRCSFWASTAVNGRKLCGTHAAHHRDGAEIVCDEPSPIRFIVAAKSADELKAILAANVPANWLIALTTAEGKDV